MNERAIALEIVSAVLERGEYSHLQLQAFLNQEDKLDKRQRAFLSRLVEGTLERRITLDAVIERYSKTPLRKMKPMIRGCLRLGVYQILYMDAIPDAAACNESVKLIAKRYRPLKGFVNGLLRNIAREQEQIGAWIEQSEPSVRYSMPDWIVGRLQRDYGAAAALAMLESFLLPKPICIRTNIARTSPEELYERLRSEGVELAPLPELNYAFAMHGHDAIASLAAFQEGLFYVQDISSMQVAEWAHPKAGEQILDVCAAPGGKSLHLAEKLQALGGSGQVLSRDLSQRKVDRIQENIKRSQLTQIRAEVFDARVDDPNAHGRYDLVLADLPCSGLGVMGRKPEIRYRLHPEDIASLARLQGQILSVVSAYVKEGGRLLYSTCTISHEENEDNVRRFLQEHPEFTLVRQEQILPDERQDGFFIALLTKKVG